MFVYTSLVVTLILHLAYLLYDPYLHHDVAQYLSAGQLFVNGATPYVEIIDTNPPMIIYISAIAAAVAKYTHLSLATCGLTLYFLLVVLTGAVFVKAFSCSHTLFVYEKNVIGTYWLFLSMLVYASGNFGQREHLLFLMVSPLILIRYARYWGRPVEHWLAMLVASLAALSLALKPFYVLTLAVTELVFAAHAKRLRAVPFFPELLVLVTVGLLYLGHFLIVPGMSSYYSEWAMFMAKGYAAYNTSLYLALRTPYPFLTITFFAGAAFLCLLPIRKWSCATVLASTFGWFGLASAALYVLQRKGWEYQLLPYFLGVATGLFILMLEKIRKQSVRDTTLRLTSQLAGCLAVSSVALFLVTAGPRSFIKSPFVFPVSRYSQVITALTHPYERVLFVDSSVEPAFPALTYTDRQFAGRFLCAYPIAFIFHDSSDYEVPPTWQKEERAIYEMFVEDVRHLQPRLVFIRARAGGQALPAYFSITQYFKQRGFYETALGNYTLLGYVGPFEVHLLSALAEQGHKSDETIATTTAIRTLRETNILSHYPS